MNDKIPLSNPSCDECGKELTGSETQHGFNRQDDCYYCNDCVNRNEFCSSCGMMLTDEYSISEGYCSDCL